MSFRNRRFARALPCGSHRSLSLEPLENRCLLAADFHVLSDVNQEIAPIGFGASQFVKIGQTLFFTANDGVSGKELW